MALGLVLATVLVLRSGDRIDVAGDVRFEGQTAVFRTTDGALYSLPLREIEGISNDGASVVPKAAPASPVPAETPAETSRKLRVSTEERQRLLGELARNRAGQPPPKQPLLDNAPVPAPPRPAAEREADEWRWRREAREFDERVLHTRENLDLLRDRIEQLRDEITSFMSLGYKPSQFTYQTTELQYALDSLPEAQLQLRRAERARDQFRDDARRQGVLPGWLR